MNREIQAVLDGKSPGCIVCADCLDVLKNMPDGCVDAVITDPPYGVELGTKTSAIGKNTSYDSIDDSPEFIVSVVVPAIIQCQRIAKCSVVWSGIRNCFVYPTPREIGGVYVSAGAGCGRWGFTCMMPILYYGNDPYLAKGLGSRPNSFASNETSVKNGHPCPKPIGWMSWAVKRATVDPNEIILDPFCGSGTTCVAAKKQGRRYIGIDISETYCKIARQRLENTPSPLMIDGKENLNVGEGKHSFF